MLEFLMVILSTAIPLSISFILAGLGEMFNQRAGIFNLGVEGIIRREIPVKVKLIIQQVGMLLIFALMLFVVYNDIIRIINK